MLMQASKDKGELELSLGTQMDFDIPVDMH